MRLSALVAAAACFVACSAAPANPNFALHEKRNGAPHQWTKRSRAHVDETLPIRIGLVQSNLHKAEEYMLDVSDPSSPNFGTKVHSALRIAPHVYNISNTCINNRPALVS